MKITPWLMCGLISLAGVHARAADLSQPAYGLELRPAQVEMADGVQLAADLFMPAGAAPGERFPVLLEYLPYRKAESRARNHSLYAYWAQRGYVVARVDIRGTGVSVSVAATTVPRLSIVTIGSRAARSTASYRMAASRAAAASV